MNYHKKNTKRLKKTRTRKNTKKKKKKGKLKKNNKEEAIHIRLALYVFDNRKKTDENIKKNKIYKFLYQINGYYNLVDINDPILNGYIENEKLTNENYGIYVNKQSKHVVLSVRGTDIFESLKDVYYDFKIVFGSELETKYYKEAYNLLKKIIKKYKDYKITLTGYSLGGRIVINLLDSNLGNHINKVYSFNPATFKEQIYQSNLCFIDDKELMKCKNREKLNIYLVNGDIISNFSMGEKANKHVVFKKHKNALINHDSYTFYVNL